MQEIIIASKRSCRQEFRITYKCGKKINFCIGRSQRSCTKGTIKELMFVKNFSSPFTRILKTMNKFIFYGKDGNEYETIVKFRSCKHAHGLIENRFTVVW